MTELKLQRGDKLDPDELDWERLQLAADRQTLIDALESDSGLVMYRRASDQLDRLLVAWRHEYDARKFIRRMFRIKNSFKYKAPSDHDRAESREFCIEYIEWFNGLVESLPDESKDIVKREAQSPKDRHRADKWAAKWGKSQRTYYNRLRDVREFLVAAISRK